MNEIMVSIIVLNYNQEQYIRKCLDSLIKQKCKYRYEIIVHDDCSSDTSISIIKEYVQSYPNIIRPIFQTENKWTKVGGKIIIQYIYPVVSESTKYIAICEADDYWSDEYKLQKQVDILENNPNCSFCVAKVLKVTEDDQSMNEYYPPSKFKEGIIRSEDFIKLVLCENYAFQTSSYMYPISYYRQLKTIPTFVMVCKIFDQVMQLFYGDKTDVYYIDEAMSCYRVLSEGSWTQKNLSDKELYLNHQKNMIDTITEYNKYTNGKYKEYCDYFILKREWKIVFTNEDYKGMLKREYRLFFKKLDFRSKTYAVLNAYFPWLIRIKKHFNLCLNF